MEKTAKTIDELFLTPEEFEDMKYRHLSGPNGWLLFAACSSGIDFAEKVKKDYEEMLRKKNSQLLQKVPLIKEFEENGKKKEMTIRFEDTETCPRLPRGLEGHVAGSDVYVFQCVHESISGRTVNENLMELYQMLRTLKVHRAKTVTAVLPYLAYSRQDKPTFLEREASLSKLNADLMIASGANGVLSYHLHTEGVRGFFEPHAHVVPLTGLDLFLDIFSEFQGKSDIVAVSPDAGGLKFVLKFSEMMDLGHAVMNKYRYTKDSSSLLGVVGALDGKKKAVILDDETVTGSSLINAGRALKDNYSIDEIHAAVSHLKITKNRISSIIDANKNGYLTTLNVTDSIPQPDYIKDLPFVKIYGLSKRIATVINMLHYNQSVKALLHRR